MGDRIACLAPMLEEPGCLIDNFTCAWVKSRAGKKILLKIHKKKERSHDLDHS